MYDEFQEMYKVFSESSYDCLDPESTVGLGTADLQVLSLSQMPLTIESVYLLARSLCVSFGSVVPVVL